MGGACVGVDFTPRFGARLEGLLVMRGAEFSLMTPFDDQEHESTWTVNDVELPLLLVAGMPVLESMRLCGFAGPTLAFNVKSEIDTRHAGRRPRVPAASRVEGATTILEDVAGQSIDVKPRGLGVMLSVKVPLAPR